MHAKDVLKHALTMNDGIMTNYLSDLADSDLLVRPVPGANHIAWQLGHLIAAEAQYFLPQIPGAAVPELPAGFDKQHTKEMASSLHVSIKTIETHRRQIMLKLNIFSVAELTKFAIREGLTSLEH